MRLPYSPTARILACARPAIALAVTLAVAGCGAGGPVTQTTPVRVKSPAGAVAPSEPAGGPVPVHTRATSITFVSPTTGFVLGTAPCAHKPCSVILRTRDHGGSWVGLPAPRESVSTVGGTGLWSVRFADPERGFAYGDGVWETTDGGSRWQRVTPPGHFIIDLEAVQDRELVAVAAPCSGTTRGCQSRHESLYHRPLIGGAWSHVTTPPLGVASASVTVHGADVLVLAGTRLLFSTNGGNSFRAISQPCSNRGTSPGPTSVTDDGEHVYLLCVAEPGAGSARKYVYRRDGSTWTLVGKPPMGGDGGVISAGSDHAIIIASSSAGSLLYRSTTAGRTWSTALQLDSGGAPWGDLGFTTPTDGVVIEGPAAVGVGSDSPLDLGRVLLTDDGGQTWTSSRF